MDTLLALGVAVVIAFFFLHRYLRGLKKTEERARAAAEKGKLYSEGPRSQHPHIDTTFCIGCQSCTMVCPEGDVLAMLGGKAVIVNGYKCIGHSLCAEACPVGAITMVMASPSMSADMPQLTPEYETNVQNLFIVGELGGLALIKNAVNQGRECIDTIDQRLNSMGSRPAADVYDVLIVGAGAVCREGMKIPPNSLVLGIPGRVARETMAAYHEEQLLLLLERVRDGFRRLDAGEIDAFELDDLIHRYKRSARELWKLCSSSGSGWERAAGNLKYLREQGEELPDWWAAGEPRRYH